MSAAAFAFQGAALLADASGALYWPAAQTLAVADLHLEKGSAFAVKGTPLPPYDSRETLRRLEIVLRRHRPRRVICLGDSFHDTDGAGRLARNEIDTLRRLTAAHDWIWITGNHDPEPADNIGGSFHETFTLGALTFRHMPTGFANEICGHLHPVARVAHRGRAVSRRCFAADDTRMVMPAFGAFTGGLNVGDEYHGYFHKKLAGFRLHTGLDNS